MPDKIIVYGSPVCAMVPPVRRLLKQAEADHEYVDIARSETDRERVKEINQGYASVPTLVFPDGSTLTEPSLGELEARLRALGYEVPTPTGQEQVRRVLEHGMARTLAILILGAGLIAELPWLVLLGGSIVVLSLFLTWAGSRA